MANTQGSDALDHEGAECVLVRVQPDGRLVVRQGDLEHVVRLYGVEIPQPLDPRYFEVLTHWLPRARRPLRCVATGPGQVRLRYFAWQDKSGDVWRDVATLLLAEGLVRVADGDFPERDEYVGSLPG
jgi:hypothetical protein